MSPTSPPSPDGRAARWAGHRERRRAEIVERAVVVLGSEGPDAPVEAIARACGVTRQVLYRQFDHRQDLDTAIADHVLSMLLQHLIGRMTPVDGIESGLRGTIDGFLDFVLEHRPLYDFVRRLPAVPGSGDPVDRLTGTLVDVVAEIATEVMPDALRGFPVREVYATGLVGLGEAVVSRWLADPAALSREETVDALVDLLLVAIDAISARGTVR